MAETDLDVALAIADLADAKTLPAFLRRDFRVDYKADTSPVTEVDRETEQLVRRLLQDARPSDDIAGEEFGGTTPSSHRQWVIDPIDGTKNFVRGVPVWATLIALVVDGNPSVGVVSAPALGRRWWASDGGGAWMKLSISGASSAPVRLSVSAVDSLDQASLSYSDAIGWQELHGADLGEMSSRFARTRAYGDFYSHMLVAEGAVDVSAEPELNAWDMAALIPILSEAGGAATAFDGRNALAGGSLLCSNGRLHAAALSVIQPPSQSTESDIS